MLQATAGDGCTFTNNPMTYQATRQCACCGAAFIALHPAATYCGDRCRARAYHRRRSTRLLPPVTAAAIEVREWQGHPIQRRQPDGYVNATAMCQAGGREWFTYARSARTKEYIAALQAVPQICGTDLVDIKQGGRPDQQGTWIHPRLAVDLARWISPAFAVWMDGWFLEAIQPHRHADPDQLALAMCAADDLGKALLGWTHAIGRLHRT